MLCSKEKKYFRQDKGTQRIRHILVRLTEKPDECQIKSHSGTPIKMNINSLLFDCILTFFSDYSLQF